LFLLDGVHPHDVAQTWIRSALRCAPATLLPRDGTVSISTHGRGCRSRHNDNTDIDALLTGAACGSHPG